MNIHGRPRNRSTSKYFTWSSLHQQSSFSRFGWYVFVFFSRTRIARTDATESMCGIQTGLACVQRPADAQPKITISLNFHIYRTAGISERFLFFRMARLSFSFSSSDRAIFKRNWPARVRGVRYTFFFFHSSTQNDRNNFTILIT